jgi:hypothetical protein
MRRSSTQHQRFEKLKAGSAKKLNDQPGRTFYTWPGVDALTLSSTDSFVRNAFVVKENAPPNPEDVGLFGAPAVMARISARRKFSAGWRSFAVAPLRMTISGASRTEIVSSR